MGDNSAIQWTDATWNPVTGCTRVSPGCAYCYIERSPPFRIAGRKFESMPAPTARTVLVGEHTDELATQFGPARIESTGLILYPDRLDQPLHWKRPRRIFVNSLSDLFHEDIPESFIDQVFAVMALAPQHTFQILTKRPERMRAYMTKGNYGRRPGDGGAGSETEENVYQTAWEKRPGGVGARTYPRTHPFDWDWPLRNVWLGVTAENQHWADERIPILLDTPAAVRFVSLEPLLGPIDLLQAVNRFMPHQPTSTIIGIDWVIAGGESHSTEARRLVLPNHEGGYYPKPTGAKWVREIRDQCVRSYVPFHFKQWGGPTPKSGGRTLDGREWDEFPS